MEEAFKRAKALNRPLLLDVGAVWCPWCGLMDARSVLGQALHRLGRIGILEQQFKRQAELCANAEHDS